MVLHELSRRRRRIADRIHAHGEEVDILGRIAELVAGITDRLGRQRTGIDTLRVQKREQYNVTRPRRELDGLAGRAVGEHEVRRHWRGQRLSDQLSGRASRRRHSDGDEKCDSLTEC